MDVSLPCGNGDRLFELFVDYAMINIVTNRRLWIIQNESVAAVDSWCDIYDSVVATNPESRIVGSPSLGTVVAFCRKSYNIRM